MPERTDHHKIIAIRDSLVSNLEHDESLNNLVEEFSDLLFEKYENCIAFEVFLLLLSYLYIYILYIIWNIQKYNYRQTFCLKLERNS
jgi:hypothetical protein